MKFSVFVAAVILSSCVLRTPQDPLSRIERWRPAEQDGEGMDHFLEMISSLKLRENKNIRIVGVDSLANPDVVYADVRMERSAPRKIRVRSGGEAFDASPGVSRRVLESGYGASLDFGKTQSVAGILMRRNGAYEYAAILFEGGPLYH